MPSSNDKRSKDLHLASSIGDLNKLSDPGVQTGREANAKLLCKSADKVFLKAEEHDLDGDQEHAYVFYMRYFNIISLVKKTKQYQSNKKYFQDLLGTAKAKRAVGRAEILQKSLSERYEELKVKKEEEIRAQEIAKRKEQEIEKEKAEKKHNKNSLGGDKNYDSIDDDLDDLLNDGTPILTSSDVYERLKVNHSIPLTPQSSGSALNGDLPPDVKSTGSRQSAPSVSAVELYSLFQSLSPTSLLILDTRSRVEYSDCHIQHRSCISIPQEMIDQGVSVGSIERRLPERTRIMWKERSKKEIIIILDKSTNAVDVTSSSKIQCLKDAIYKYDSYSSLQKEPVFLDGGFDSWLWHYPSLTTNPQLPKITSAVSKADIPDLSSLDYPELPGYEEKSIPAVPEKNDTKMVNGVSPIPAPRTDLPNAVVPAMDSSTSTSNFTSKSSISDAYPSSLSALTKQDHEQEKTIPDMSKIDSKRTAQPPPAGEGVMHSTSVINGGIAKPLVPEPAGTQNPTPVTRTGDFLPSTSDSTVQPVVSTSGAAQASEKIPSASVPYNAQPQPSPKLPSSNPVTNNKPYAPQVLPANLSVGTRPQSVMSTVEKPSATTGPMQHSPQQSVGGGGTATATQLMPNKQSDGNGPMQSSLSAQKQLLKQQPQPVNNNTYTTTPGLPTGWEKVIDPNTSRVYYKDHNTHTTHWTAPRSGRKTDTSSPGGTVPATKLSAGSHQQGTTGVQQNQLAPKSQETRKEVRKPEKSLEPKKSGLHRSLSSPNLAKLVQDKGSPKVQGKPTFDRGAKPPEKSRPRVNRGMKPLSMQTLDLLSPVHGGSGTGLTGLRNLGNTCYMNSVIQCLSSMAPLAAYFISGAYVDDLNRSNSMGTRGELCEEFSVLVRVLHSGQFRYVSPTTFKKTVGRFKSDFSGFDQQDSQELLSFLMEALHEDTNRVLKKPIVKPPADDLDALKAAEVAWNNHKLRNQSLMVELFDGLFKSTVRCLTCQKESVTFETFSNLTLPLPPHTNHCSLEDCVRLFSKPERMAGDDKWRCPSCKVYRDASKRIQIWKLPPILIVHLKRFQYEGMWRQKLQADVKCPLHNLQLTDDVVGPNSSKTYHLYAVSNHYGTMHGGHYTAFCKSVYNDQWYKFDDQFVTRMAAQDVMTSAAYLLFYTSLDFHPPKILL